MVEVELKAETITRVLLLAEGLLLLPLVMMMVLVTGGLVEVELGEEAAATTTSRRASDQHLRNIEHGLMAQGEREGLGLQPQNSTELNWLNKGASVRLYAHTYKKDDSFKFKN